MSYHSQRNMSLYIDLLSAQMCTTECCHLASIHGADMGYCITTHQLWKYSIGLDISCIGSDYSKDLRRSGHTIRSEGFVCTFIYMNCASVLYQKLTSH